jgi:hypothetical protein
MPAGRRANLPADPARHCGDLEGAVAVTAIPHREGVEDMADDSGVRVAV